MKLETIDLVDFGSHRATRWDPGDARLCVLVGPMGAGKTTLIEGIRHALYKDDRGSIDGVVRTGATESAVTIEFSLAGARYRATRRRSIRAGGKSSADLQMQTPTGTWAPVASGDKEVPAAVRALLHMDEATFRSSVFLAQGDLKRFVQATPGKGSATEPGRATLLSTIVVDPRFALAEVEARGRATKLEAQAAAESGLLERLVDAIAELEPSRDRVTGLTHTVHEIARDQTAAATARATLNGRLLELVVELEAATAAEATVIRLEAERTDLVERYRREHRTIAESGTAIEAAWVAMAAADEVAQAVEDLPTMRLEVESLEAAERQDAELATQARNKLDAIAALEHPYQLDHAAWSVRWKDAKKAVAELDEHARAKTSVCDRCGQPIGQKVALEQLNQARDAVKAFEAVQPKEPLAIAREKAALERIRIRQNELDWDPGILIEARRQLAGLERTAARGEVIAAARVALETAKTATAEATAALGKIRALGEIVATDLAAAKTTVAAVAGLRAEHATLQTDLAAKVEEIGTLERDRHEAERGLASAEANVARLDALVAEQDELKASVAGQAVRIARLRKLVASFGVKGIPARIVERVLPELGRYANDMLGQLVPGASIEIRAQRASSDGKSVIEAIDLVYRDAEGERAMDRPSGGETTAVSLALAMGLNRLNARRSGSPIRLLVVDEPDGLDVPARRALGRILLELAHGGDRERVLLITHTPDLVDFADAVWQFSKNGHGTEMEQVA